MPSSVPHLRRARRAASLRVQLSSCVSVCTIRSLRASQPAHRSRPAAGSDMRERGRGNKPYTTIQVRQAQKSLHRRSHKGGRGGGLMSARRASRRLTGGAPGIPGNNNQPPRRQQRVSVAGRLSFRSRRLPDAVAGPSVSSCSATPQLQETYSARSMMPIASCPQEGTRARAERGFAAARQVLRRASRVTAAVAVNRGASHFQLGNLYAGQTA
jgi:hypothetical protein